MVRQFRRSSRTIRAFSKSEARTIGNKVASKGKLVEAIDVIIEPRDGIMGLYKVFYDSGV